MRKLLIISLLFISCNSVRYEKIKSVYDGDTATTIYGEHLRLANLDAPEIGEIGGNEAKKYLSDIILNKTVKLVTHGKDKYGRTIADIYINGLYVNEEEIKAGFCFVYRAYSSRKLYNEYLTARRNKVGIWAGYTPEIPFLYRKQHSIK